MDTEKKIPTTRPVHYEDDFDFVLHLYSVLVDPEGNVTRREELPFPKYDFTATFRTGCTARSFTASCIGGVCTNCYNDAGRVHVVADGHGLGPGPLRCKLTCELPDEVFPDGTRRMVVPENLNIELTKEKGAYPSTIEAEVLLPYIKGDKGDAADMYRLDRRIRRGIIPFKARRGIMYYDMGSVKVCYKRWAPYGASRIVSDTERVFDLSRFEILIGDDAKVYVLAHQGNEGIKQTYEWYMSHLSYEPKGHLLTLTGSIDDWERVSVIVSRREEDSYHSICNRKERDYVVYFDKDMKLYCSDAGIGGASEFMHTLTSESAAAAVDGFRPNGPYGYVAEGIGYLGGKNIKVWRYRSRKRISKKNPHIYNRFRRFSLWQPVQDNGECSNDELIGKYLDRNTRLFRVQIKTGKGYTSRKVRVSRRFVCRNDGSDLEIGKAVAID